MQAVVIGLVFMALGASACSGPDAVTVRTPVATPTAMGSTSSRPSPPSTYAATPQPTGPPSPKTSNSLARLVMPPEARADTSAGAEAFARYYFSLINVSFGGADPHELVPHSDASCRSCANFVSGITQLQAQGLVIRPTPYVIENFNELPESTPKLRTFAATLTRRESTVLRQDGSVKRVDKVDQTLVEFGLSRQNTAWMMREISQIKGAKP